MYKLFKRACKEEVGYGLYSLRTLKLDGRPSGIPIVNIYTDKNYALTSGMASETVPRFDWVDLTNSCVQLLSLLQLCYPKDDVICSIYFYIAADTERVTKKLFPTVNNKRYLIYYIM